MTFVRSALYEHQKRVAAERAIASLAAKEAVLASVVRRDPCARCGVRGDIGCRHQPLEAA